MGLKLCIEFHSQTKRFSFDPRKNPLPEFFHDGGGTDGWVISRKQRREFLDIEGSKDYIRAFYIQDDTEKTRVMHCES